KPIITPIDIGFAQRPKRVSVAKTDEERAVLEWEARKMELLVDPETTEFLSFTVLQHYEIFEHLFAPGTFFHNVQDLDVAYGDNAVHFGNTISVSLLSSKPEVKIESVKAGEYNTLILSLAGWFRRIHKAT
uniref:Condensation domain-containing protein n=1 Tax=Haemonchus contortus TaxID=6289 RepID=A0A7I5E5U8_HAECO